MPALGVAERERPPRPADTRVDDREVDADGHEADRVRENERALQDRRRRDPVRDVDDLRLRRDALDDAVARADEVVLQPEVAQKRDEHAAERNAGRRAGATGDGLPAGAAATRRRPTRLAAQARRRAAGSGRTRSAPGAGRGLVTTSRSIFVARRTGHASGARPWRRASSTSSAVSRWSRTSLAAMIAT